jgi:Cytoskeletal-regulatory complex EF hand
LPIEILKNIWTVADQPSTSSLDPAKFAVALRLIQLTQNGQKGQGPTLAAPPGVQLRPVYFEGVSGVSVPMPPAAPGGPSPRQQQAPPTPQQQQQRGMTSPERGPPPPSTAQQYQQRPPLSPQRGPGGPPQSMQMMMQQQQQPPPTPDSRALVGQDPYTMTPQERARYEALFPEYAKPDGYMYGQEAVALFSKSGVNQAILRDIWNMVDRPVDNRLDRLEFAMAMHLIVCISKKNLPPPQGGTLPNSLLALKAATDRPVSVPTLDSPARASIPEPAAPLSPMPPPQQMQQPQPSMRRPPQVETVEETPVVAPPPVVPGGGMSISDAFDGLSLTSEPPRQYGSSTPAPAESRSLPAYIPEAPTTAFEAIAPVSPQPSYSHPSSIPEPTQSAWQQAPASPPAPAVTSPSMTVPSSSSYDLGDAHSELDKLKSVLQKLQAENISLKAQMGNMSEDEKEVRKELGAVVAEIGKLSSELSVQRQQVLDAKNRLLEASAELKAHQEHKG